jgi:hypothetical protein
MAVASQTTPSSASLIAHSLAILLKLLVASRKYGTLNIAITIIANSTNGGDCFGGGTIGTNLNNLVKDGALNNNFSASPGSGKIFGDPLLGPLANNIGTTYTMALGALSPAITAGDATKGVEA